MTPTDAARPRLDLRRVLARDRGRLIARERALITGKTPPADRRWHDLHAEATASTAAFDARSARVPPISIDESLPIARDSETITAAIARYPVVVIAGETGSGKTTQIPKLCLAAGRGRGGWIGCTQPRRIAARQVAKRVAEELGDPRLVGSKVRFSGEVEDFALIKFMTDGMLLAETEGDRWLSRYDTLILDEAHERSLNIDFLLGYLKRLVGKRRDLRIVVTSATIDTARFAAFFDGAPVIEVEGRGYPVSVRYRPPDPNVREAPDLTESLIGALDEVTVEDPIGDVLVFLPGEREIRDAHLALTRRRYRATDVLPLYARLSANDQDRVFKPGPGRRIVLATNVAETSLTVPRIKWVIDAGLARVNRYSKRHKVQRLHIEPVAQAQADQRKGRAGRVSAGVCVRLFSEANFNARPRFADPELKRASLAGVMLRLLALKLGPIELFPFLDPPDDAAIADGYQELAELGALSADRRGLTDTGRQMARLPIDVKLARVLVAAQQLGALGDATPIAAFLSIQDPRERPAEARALADSAHAHYADAQSDFVGLLNLWRDYQAAHAALTGSKLRDWCQTRFLSFMRMREWRELHRQLIVLYDELGWRGGTFAAAVDDAEPRADAATSVALALGRTRYETLHRALIAGFPSHAARREEKTFFAGTRGRRYHLFPASALNRKPPPWLLSATLLDTQRLYALTNAAIEPAWIEAMAAHLIKRRHFDPHWSRAQGRVLGFESLTLLGLTVIERRRIAYERIDPAAARQVFIADALVTGEIDCRAAFVKANLAMLERARAEEEKRRTRGLLRDDAELAAWLDQRIAPGIANAQALDAWVKGLDRDQRRSLEWTLDDLLKADAVPARAFPTTLGIGTRALPLAYRFDPADASDGVTVELPLALLNALPESRLGWLVPGLIVEKVTALIRELPKPLRRNLVPAPDFARAFVDAARVGEHSDAELSRHALADALSAHFERMTGVAYAPALWDDEALPPHLRFNVRLWAEDGALLATSRDIRALRAEYGARARAEFARQTATDIARDAVARWDFGALPATIATDAGLAAYPALVTDSDGTVAIRVFDATDAANASHPRGVVALAKTVHKDLIRQSCKQLPLSPKAAIAWTAIASPDELRGDIVDAAFDAIALPRALAVRDAAAFDSLLAMLKRELFQNAIARLAPVEATLVAYASIAPKLAPELLGFARANYDDLRQQLDALVDVGFARDPELLRIADRARFIAAMEKRLERLKLDPRKDQARMLVARGFVERLAAIGPRLVTAAQRTEESRIRWLIEELRVQLFAQELGNREPVSEKKLTRAIADLEAAIASD